MARAKYVPKHGMEMRSAQVRSVQCAVCKTVALLARSWVVGRRLKWLIWRLSVDRLWWHAAARGGRDVMAGSWRESRVALVAAAPGC